MARAERPVSASCAGVCRTYHVGQTPVDALVDVSKQFPARALTVIAGPSGSGKSSLLRILACVERPDSGTVEVAGRPVGDASTRRRRALRRRTIGYLFQDPIDNLVEYLTAADQMRLAAWLRGTRIDDTEIEEVLGSLNIGHRRDHRPHQLSGGEQQRVALACSMVGAAPVIVADEPTAELDSAAAEQVLDGVRVSCERGAAFLIASHDPRIIERADHLLMLDHGRVTQSW